MSSLIRSMDRPGAAAGDTNGFGPDFIYINYKDLRLYRPYACSLASLVQLASVIGQFGLLNAGIRRESVLFLSAWTTGDDDELVLSTLSDTVSCIPCMCIHSIIQTNNRILISCTPYARGRSGRHGTGTAPYI